MTLTVIYCSETVITVLPDLGTSWRVLWNVSLTLLNNEIAESGIAIMLLASKQDEKRY